MAKCEIDEGYVGIELNFEDQKYYLKFFEVKLDVQIEIVKLNYKF